MDSPSQAKTYYERGGGKSVASAAMIAGVLKTVARSGPTLDVGCGDGSLLEALDRKDFDVWGVDASEHAVELSRGRVPQASVTRSDVQIALPFPDAFFQNVVMLDVLEHLRSPVAAIDEIRRVMREDGVLLLTTPNANSPFRLMRGKKWFGVADPDHRLLFTRFTLGHVLTSCGLRPVFSRTEAFTGSILDGPLRALGMGGTILMIARKSEELARDPQ